MFTSSMPQLLRAALLPSSRRSAYKDFGTILVLHLSTQCSLSASRSPSARDHQSARRRELLRGASQPLGKTAEPYLVQEKWPMHFLDASSRSGGLPIKSQTAVDVLEDFQKLGRRPTQGSIQGLCSSNVTRCQLH